MRVLKLGQLMVRLAGGTDREGGGDGPLVVLMHGFGAPATDLVPLFRSVEVPPEVRFAFPAAPLVLDANAPDELAPRAWWMVDIARMQQSLLRGEGPDLAREAPPGLATARTAVLGMLAELEEKLRAPPERVILGGFSQGAMLATDVALRMERPPAGLVILSGAPLCVGEWQTLVSKRAGLPVLQSHGRADPILPYAGGEWLRDLLEGSRLAVEWVPFNGGHGIPDGVLDRLGPFVTTAAAKAKSEPASA
jgi:phospholipase/carboxylesterase